MRRFYVRRSAIHGRGVFASAVMARGDYLLEYKGEILSEREANRRFARSEGEAGHTFFFGIGDGRVIDGAVAGNSARWINHSCAPNCEAEQDNDRVYIRAIKKIKVGDEIFIDYRLDAGSRPSKERWPRSFGQFFRSLSGMLGGHAAVFIAGSIAK